MSTNEIGKQIGLTLNVINVSICGGSRNVLRVMKNSDFDEMWKIMIEP